MKAKINGYEVEGTVSEMREILGMGVSAPIVHSPGPQEPDGADISNYVRYERAKKNGKIPFKRETGVRLFEFVLNNTPVLPEVSEAWARSEHLAKMCIGQYPRMERYGFKRIRASMYNSLYGLIMRGIPQKKRGRANKAPVPTEPRPIIRRKGHPGYLDGITDGKTVSAFIHEKYGDILAEGLAPAEAGRRIANKIGTVYPGVLKSISEKKLARRLALDIARVRRENAKISPPSEGKRRGRIPYHQILGKSLEAAILQDYHDYLINDETQKVIAERIAGSMEAAYPELVNYGSPKHRVQKIRWTINHIRAKKAIK
jgi:hypothetical protein